MAEGSEMSDQLSYKANQSKLFMMLTENLLDKICDDVKFDTFQQATENIRIFKQKSKKVHKIYATFNNTLKTQVMEEVNEIFKDDDLDNTFCKLNDILSREDCSNNKSLAWRPSGKVDEDVRSHLMAIKLKQKSDLESLLTFKEESINNLKIRGKTLLVEVQRHNDMLTRLITQETNNSEEYNKQLKTISNS